MFLPVQEEEAEVEEVLVQEIEEVLPVQGGEVVQEAVVLHLVQGVEVERVQEIGEVLLVQGGEVDRVQEIEVEADDQLVLE